MTHLIIETDGRTELHGDLTELDYEQMRAAVAAVAPEYETARGILGGTPLPIPAGHGLNPMTMWVAESTVLRCDGLRNIPASLLLGQYERRIVLLCGRVVLTGDPADPTAWHYATSLIEDITRVLHGLPVGATDPEWPGAVRLAAGYLNGVDRVTLSDEAVALGDTRRVLLGMFGADAAPCCPEFGRTGHAHTEICGAFALNDPARRQDGNA